MINRRAVANHIIKVLLLTMLLLGSTNVMTRQRQDSHHNNRTLTSGPALHSAAQVSGDGLIAFSAANQIYVMNADGSDIRRLTDGTPCTFNQYPTFSPDGLRVAFIRFQENIHEYGLYVVEIDGSGLRPLVNGSQTLSEPSWSPDGSKIAFLHGQDTTIDGFAYNFACHPEIYVIDVFSHKQENLTKGAGGTDPAWSPDGTQIAFSSFREDSDEIYTMDSHGNNVQRLTDTRWAEAEPAWSPDGKQIAYAAHLLQVDVYCGFIPTGRPPEDITKEMTSIYVMNANGTDQTELEMTRGGNEPAWSPDSAWLTFVLSNKSGDQIYVTDASGTSLTQLTLDSTQKSSPSWSQASK
jgi:Tol biopolymer transport system component